MKFIKAFLASVALIVAASSAHADVVDLGPLTETYDHTKTVAKNTTFSDFYTFELDATGAEFSISKIILTNKAGDRYNFSTLTFSVFSGTYGDLDADALLYSVSVPTAEEVQFDLNALTAGSYYVQVAGITSGASGGTYAFSITPVPEPSSVAMLLIGFAALGAVARRRKTL
ncbi:FxDxF family PEP-CTERM protein [Methylobacillus pratensis]